MKCVTCGYENKAGSKFCASCGALLPESKGIDKVKEAIAAKPSTPKKALQFAVPAVVVVIAVVVAVIAFNRPKDLTAKNSISIYKSEDMVVVSGNNNPKFTINGVLRSSQTSMDGSKAVVLNDYEDDTGGTLWYLTTSGSSRIADDVFEYQISDSGGGIAYLTDYDSEDNTAILYLYDTSSQSSTRIVSEVYYRGCILSPNGKTVAYMSDYDNNSGEFAGYLKVEGKPAEKLGDNMYPIAISDSGSVVYYFKLTISDNSSNGSLNVRSGSNDNRLIADISSSFEGLLLNKDYSQAIINYDGKAYISRNGSERERIHSSTISGLVLPRGTQTSGNSMGAVCGTSNFANTLALDNDGVIYIDDKYETTRILGSAYKSMATISNDGKTLLFISSSDNLCSIDPTKANAERVTLARDVVRYVASDDGKTIYYVNDDDELWCIKGNNDAVRISDDVYPNQLALSYSSNRVFFLVDYNTTSGGQLYFSNNGGAKTRVAGGNDVRTVTSTPTSIFYRTAESDLYRSNGNEEFSLFQYEVN
jgi:hypothetical protein